jgi:hypothetical protein
VKAVALVLAVLALGAQRPEPPVLPPGQFCVHVTRQNPRPAHPCACQRECLPTEDEQGRQTVGVREDAQCTQYCHADHCHCPIKNCD